MADKPSRALVLYGDGLALGINAQSHSNLNSLASKSSCGFLSLPVSPPLESEEERIVREIVLLLDAYDGPHRNKGSEKDSMITSVSERFMGMKAVVVTNHPGVKSFCGKLGFAVLAFNELLGGKDFEFSKPSIGCTATELMKLLGFEEGKVLEVPQFDLVFVHIGAGGWREDVSSNVDYANALVGGIMQLAPPGLEVGSRLHLSVVMSYGRVTEVDSSNFSIAVSKDEMDPALYELFPRQSYTMRGEKPRDNVRHHSPMLIAQWQYAVTRVDMVETFSFRDFKEHGGNLVIPADKFLHEIAFKLWKAPKYGA